MWNRQDLKRRAKAAFQRNYWYCVFAALIMAIVMGAGAGGITVKMDESSTQSVLSHMQIAFRSTGLVMFLIGLFVMNPFAVGCRKFFADNSVQKTDMNVVTIGFTGNYMRNVLAMFLTNLFIVLWSLLLVIPGIVKAYAYRMVPYILADNPEMDAMDAINESSRMMQGHKWAAFVLDLSFIGWHILSVFTLGLLELFYVAPYVAASDAELYQTLKNKAV